VKFSLRPQRTNVRLLQIAAGLGCTLFFLALALYRVQLGAVGAALASADPLWIGAAMLIYAGNLALRAWRWRVILRPVAAIPYAFVARALLVGYGLNAVMPARLGELFRAEFFKKTFGLSRVWGLTSIVIERLFDGIMVVCCLALGLLFAAAAKPNASLLFNLLATGGAVFGVVLLAALCLSGTMMPRIVRRFPGLSARLTMMQQGLEIPANMADIAGYRDHNDDIRARCVDTVVACQGSRIDARVFGHPGPPWRRQSEYSRTVRPGLPRHAAIRLCACGRIRGRHSRTWYCRGNSGATLRASPSGTNCRRYLASQLRNSFFYASGEAAIR